MRRTVSLLAILVLGVNIHTAGNPGGVARGQLARVQ